jgi:hypothetical protein
LLQQGQLKPEDSEPEISQFRYYIDAFHELSSCRSIGMALGPIPFTAIAEYSKLFDVEDFEEFHYLMRIMDHKFLEMKAAKAKSQSSKTPTKSKGKK